MAGVLNFQQYIGGPDNVITEQAFPSTQRTLAYNYDRDITGWTITADYQTIVVDTVQFNRLTGQPNFSNSKVIGTFPKVEITGNAAPTIIDAAVGTVKVVLPAGMYSGAIVPDARQNVPIVVVSITWADTETPPNVNSHRWALIQAWEPDVTPGDPTLEDDYTPLTLGA